MLIWPFVIIAVAILVLVLSNNTDGANIDGGPSDLRFLYFSVLTAGVVLAGLGGMLIRGGRRTMINSAVLLGLGAGLIIAFTFRFEVARLIGDIRAGFTPNVAVTRVWGEETLHRGWDGHYTALAQVNGVGLKLLIDTGASMVLIPYEQAPSVGIDVETLEFSVPVTTANGRSSVAPVTLKEIRINSIFVRNVRAAVAQPERLRTGLLGISFLDQLSEFTFRGSELTLRQSPDDYYDN